MNTLEIYNEHLFTSTFKQIQWSGEIDPVKQNYYIC